MNSSELRAILASDVVAAAPKLLGAILEKGAMRAQVIEVEAYRSDDPACHAYQKRTPRTEVMYGSAGTAYVYFNYGVHWMLNIVAHGVDDPAAILIRAAIPLSGLDEMRGNRQVERDRDLLSGPGKLAQAFGIDGRLNGADLLNNANDDLNLTPPVAQAMNVYSGPRIGIAVGKWHDVPWRFVDREYAEWASRPLR